MTYQQHTDAPSVSDSRRKLSRIQLPDDLSGKSVLDIGCNEGFFCAEVSRRGAKRVVGIDTDKAALEFAKAHYQLAGVSFEERKWSNLPSGPFDVVLWLSSMHYEQDPAHIFSLIRRELAPGGLLILECGINANADAQFSIPVPRHSDTPLYPPMPMLRKFLRGWSLREMAEGEVTSGDQTPRHVFHCRPMLPQVVLITGGSAIGKSSLAGLIAPSATKVIALDRFLTALRWGEVHDKPLERFVLERCDTNHLEQFFNAVDEAGLCDAYTNLLARAIAPSDELVVIEGYMTTAQKTLLLSKICHITTVWCVQRA